MHEVLRLWLRPVEGAPLVEVPALDLVADAGIVGDHAFGRMRHVTFVFVEDWRVAEQALGRAVDPLARRANVLLSGGGGGGLIGRRVRFGTAVVRIRAITAPCPVMDRAAAGLKDALRGAARAGVWGRVETGGRVVVGDALVALAEVGAPS